MGALNNYLTSLEVKPVLGMTKMGVSGPWCCLVYQSLFHSIISYVQMGVYFNNFSSLILIVYFDFHHWNDLFVLILEYKLPLFSNDQLQKFSSILKVFISTIKKSHKIVYFNFSAKHPFQHSNNSNIFFQ